MSDIRKRKHDHIQITLDREVEPAPSSLDRYDWPYRALPEIDLAEINTETNFFDWNISFPFMVASMTGGETHGRTINENIAKACNQLGIPFGLGSMRVINRYPDTVKTFDVKEFAPDVPMFANVGLVQLNYGFGEKEFKNIIESVKADGLCIHINHLQEAVQPEGDTNFKDLLVKLEKLLTKLEIPVIVKEVGHGIDKWTAQKLKDIGVEMIDVAGTGGTSWAWIEGYRHGEYVEQENLGHLFRHVGIPTDQSVLECKEVEGLSIIASGGVRNGLHIATSIALGANYSAAAKPFLNAALESDQAVLVILERLKRELEVAMFAAGVKDIEELTQVKLAE